MVTDAPGHCAILRDWWVLIRLTVDTGVTYVSSTYGTVLHLDIPSPHRYCVPLLYFESTSCFHFLFSVPKFIYRNCDLWQEGINEFCPPVFSRLCRGFFYAIWAVLTLRSSVSEYHQEQEFRWFQLVCISHTHTGQWAESSLLVTITQGRQIVWHYSTAAVFCNAYHSSYHDLCLYSIQNLHQGYLIQWILELAVFQSL